MSKDSPEMHAYKKRQRLKRQLWCAFFAEDAFKKTIASVEQYISLGIDSNHPLHFTFVSSIAITYSRFFISSDMMITLPGSYASFPSPELTRTHKWLIDCRNTIYAHTDASAALYELAVKINWENGKHVLLVEGKSPDMMGHSFPEVIRLCNFQKDRIRQQMGEILDQLLPTETIESVLIAEKRRSTSISIFWPKPLDPSLTAPPNKW